jgi:hypothetical protein
MTARGPLDAQGLEPGTQGLLHEDTQGFAPDAQGLERGTQGSAPDVISLHPDNPAHPQQAYRAVLPGAAT